MHSTIRSVPARAPQSDSLLFKFIFLLQLGFGCTVNSYINGNSSSTSVVTLDVQSSLAPFEVRIFPYKCTLHFKTAGLIIRLSLLYTESWVHCIAAWLLTCDNNQIYKMREPPSCSHRWPLVSVSFGRPMGGIDEGVVGGDAPSPAPGAVLRRGAARRWAFATAGCTT
jgi:hypothetical protein